MVSLGKIPAFLIGLAGYDGDDLGLTMDLTVLCLHPTNFMFPALFDPNGVARRLPINENVGPRIGS